MSASATFMRIILNVITRRTTEIGEGVIEQQHEKTNAPESTILKFFVRCKKRTVFLHILVDSLMPIFLVAFIIRKVAKIILA
jgi:hypothetical protein